MYDDTAEIRSMEENEWIENEGNFRIPRAPYVLGSSKKTKKIISSFHNIFNNIQFCDNLKL